MQQRRFELAKFPTFIFIKGSIADKALITELFEKYKPAVVVNLSAQAGVRYSITSPDAYVKYNLIGCFNILEACRHNPVEYLVYASFSSVYGSNKKVPYRTDDKVDIQVSHYAEAPVTYANTSALECGFGYKSSADLRTGLRKFAEWSVEVPIPG